MYEQQQTPSTGNTGPVTIEDVREALGETDPRHINASTVRQIIGRGSLSTIQKHLYTLRQRTGEAGDASQNIEAPEAPEAPNALRVMWEAAYGLALASVQDRLIRAHERIAHLESVNQAQCEEIEAMAELVDQTKADCDLARSEAMEARQAQAKAEAERDEALKLRDRVDALMAMIQSMAMTPQA
jgi:hypothetical protein